MLKHYITGNGQTQINPVRYFCLCVAFVASKGSKSDFNPFYTVNFFLKTYANSTDTGVLRPPNAAFDYGIYFIC